MLAPRHALKASVWERGPYRQCNEQLPDALSRHGDLHRVALDEQRHTGAARGPLQILHSFLQQSTCTSLASRCAKLLLRGQETELHSVSSCQLMLGGIVRPFPQ